MKNNRLNNCTALPTMLIVAFVLTLALCTRSVAQETPSPQPPVQPAVQPVAPDTNSFVRGYLNLGLSLANGGVFSFLGLGELSLNYTAYMKWGVLAEIGINARMYQGGGGHLLVGKTVLEHEGWRISPFLKVGAQQHGTFFDTEASPAWSYGVGLATDYELPNSLLMLGLRSSLDFSRLASRSFPDFSTGQTITMPEGLVTTPNIQFRIGWRIGD